MIDCSTCSVLGCQFNATNPKKSCEMYKPYMTPKIALHCMKYSCEMAVCENCDIYGIVGTDHCFDDACREAIKALEKQIPKEPIGRLCPNCGSKTHTDCGDSFLDYSLDYCPNCGQALKWE